MSKALTGGAVHSRVPGANDSEAAALYRSAFPLVVLGALVVRIVFFTGLFGSDDVIYIDRALAVLHGEFSGKSTYTGALRYGINLPVAAFMGLFGTSEFSATLWPLVCSVGEVAIVFLFARAIWGVRAAVLSAIVLGVLPLHVHHAGLSLADAPLAFFVTLCFVTAFFAERNRRRDLYFVAGLSLGAVYWVKEVVAPIVAVVLVLVGLVNRSMRRERLWIAGGALAMIAANMALMWWTAGDPLQLFRAIAKSRWPTPDTSLGYYLYYLFVNARHTWLMPFVALAGLVLWLLKGPRYSPPTTYVVCWCLGLLAVLSLTLVSLSPVRFIPKQTNYMLIFAAPLALLAGYALAQTQGKTLGLVLMVLVGGSLLLSALEQQAVRVFTSNTRATLRFEEAHSGTPVFGTSHAQTFSQAALALKEHSPHGGGIRPLEELPELVHNPSAMAQARGGEDTVAYVVLDQETMDWRVGTRRIAPADIPACWRYVKTLKPEGFGVGGEVLRMLLAVSDAVLPPGLSLKVQAATEWLYRPRPAYVYAVGARCRSAL